MTTIINSIEQQGVVVRQQDNRIWFNPTATCGEKDGCKGGCGSCGGKTDPKRVMVETADAAKFSPGDSIAVKSIVLNESIGAAIVFGIPLLLAVAVLVIWYFVSPQTVESGRAILTSGGGFISGFFIVWLTDRSFRRRHPVEILWHVPLHVQSSAQGI